MESNSTLVPGPLSLISTSKPGLGVAHSALAPDAENEMAVDPPRRV